VLFAAQACAPRSLAGQTRAPRTWVVAHRALALPAVPAAAQFPWALGGYDGFPKVENLAPTHRRFMTENAAYAILRVAPAVFLKTEAAGAVMAMASVSHRP